MTLIIAFFIEGKNTINYEPKEDEDDPIPFPESFFSSLSVELSEVEFDSVLPNSEGWAGVGAGAGMEGADGALLTAFLGAAFFADFFGAAFFGAAFLGAAFLADFAAFFAAFLGAFFAAFFAAFLADFFAAFLAAFLGAFFAAFFAFFAIAYCVYWLIRC